MERQYVPRCPTLQRNGRMCAHAAGHQTGHKGWGRCGWHEGATRSVERTWRDAMELAEELDINPLEALLQQVRVAAAHATWADYQLREAVRRAQEDGNSAGDEPTPAVQRWMLESRRERTLFSKISKAAVDAGVAAALVSRIDLESTAVAEAVIAGVDALELPGEMRNRALAAAHDRLLAISGPAQDEILQMPEGR